MFKFIGNHHKKAVFQSSCAIFHSYSRFSLERSTVLEEDSVLLSLTPLSSSFLIKQAN